MALLEHKKICSKCNQELTVDRFSKDSSKKDGLYSSCKECKKIKDKKWLNENKDKYDKYHKLYRKKNKDKIKKASKKWYLENKEYKLKKNKEWSKDNLKKHRQLQDRWIEENIEYINKYHRSWKKERRENDESFKILDNIRRRINRALHGSNKSDRTQKLLGCNIKKLKEHIEEQFQEGMNWDNYGFYGWHVDHIKPCVLFDLTEEEQQKECFNYKNLQPLWAEDNLKKGAKWQES